MKRSEDRTAEDTAKNIAIYNRPESDHRKVDPVTYELQPGVTWGDVYRKIQQGNAKAKKSEKQG